MATFRGSEPNGTWSLYSFSDYFRYDGTISGWSLTLETDSAAPITRTTLAPQPNSSGWVNADALLTLTGDDQGDSGVRSITYSASGAHTIPPTAVFTNVVPLGLTREGVTTLSFFATDNVGHIEATKTRIIRIDKTAPTATPPTQTLATTILASNVRITLRWSGSDAHSGVVRYVLQQNRDGGAFMPVTLPAIGAQQATLTLAPGVYQFRVRTFDRAGNASAFALGPSFRVAAFEENATCSASVTTNCSTYTGTWSQRSVAGAHGGGIREAGSAGAKARFRFNGNRVSWTTMQGPDRGKVEVWLDGMQRATLDLFATSPRRSVVFVSGALPNGTHTLEIRVLGTKRAAATGTQAAVDVFCTLRIVQ